MILPPFPGPVIDLAQTVAILLRLRQNLWKEFENAIGEDRERQWQAWNTIRRAIHHVQTRPLDKVPVPLVSRRMKVEICGERKSPARIAHEIIEAAVAEGRKRRFA